MATPTLFVVGCGHVGAAIVELGHWLGFRVVAFDDRPEMVTTSALPLADVRLSGDITSALAVASVTSETHVVVVTRNMSVDVSVLPHLLRTEARSIGVMGSHRRWSDTQAVLESQGVDAAQLARVDAPIGLELHAETPEEIALSVLSQVVAERRRPVS